MTFREAASFIMPFGKYKDMQLDSIAESDEGLKYLAWMRDTRLDDMDEDGMLADVDIALATYLEDSSIRKELGEA